MTIGRRTVLQGLALPFAWTFGMGSARAFWRREFDVLVEGFSKRSREQLCGRTEQNKMVVFDKGRHHIGETVRVRVTGSTSATLLGTATD